MLIQLCFSLKSRKLLGLEGKNSSSSAKFRNRDLNMDLLFLEAYSEGHSVLGI